MEKSKTVDEFLESNNVDYLFLLLANLEAKRLNSLPYTVKKKFPKKITEVALENVATNKVPDFIEEQEDSIDLNNE